MNQQNIGPQIITAFYNNIRDKSNLQFDFSHFPGGLYVLNNSANLLLTY